MSVTRQLTAPISLQSIFVSSILSYYGGNLSCLVTHNKDKKQHYKIKTMNKDNIIN